MLHTVVAVCYTCNKIRYRSARPFAEGERLTPQDFIPERGQDPPPTTEGTAATCTECGAQLSFKKLADKGQSTGASITEASREKSMPSGNGNSSPVHCLFEALPEESITKMEELPGQRWLVVTTRRILVIDPTLLEVPA